MPTADIALKRLHENNDNGHKTLSKLQQQHGKQNSESDIAALSCSDYLF
jgi:hypothetical protein